MLRSLTILSLLLLAVAHGFTADAPERLNSSHDFEVVSDSEAYDFVGRDEGKEEERKDRLAQRRKRAERKAERLRQEEANPDLYRFIKTTSKLSSLSKQMKEKSQLDSEEEQELTPYIHRKKTKKHRKHLHRRRSSSSSSSLSSSDGSRPSSPVRLLSISPTPSPIMAAPPPPPPLPPPLPPTAVARPRIERPAASQGSSAAAGVNPSLFDEMRTKKLKKTGHLAPEGLSQKPKTVEKGSLEAALAARIHAMGSSSEASSEEEWGEGDD